MSDICAKCGLPKEICVCEEIAREQQKITVAVDQRRYGKVMTVVEGINPHDLDLGALVSNLKSICACGGTIKEGKIELQGDHRAKVKDALTKLGFVVEVI
ncbi:MAG: stress response translation initiation inhibitor YciH [Candidatus Thermoplasmatota archaeon]